MRYGLPYMGSKSSICPWLMDHLPPAENFVDLFAGGCAVTHAALLSGHYKRVYANDTQRDVLELFKKCITTGLTDDDWAPITREEFFLRAPHDALVRLVWSFGNMGTEFYCSEKDEHIKEVIHIMLTSKTIQKRIDSFFYFLELLMSRQEKPSKKELEKHNFLRPQSIFALLRLQIDKIFTDNLYLSFVSYDLFSIPPCSCVYADPPYAGTTEYNGRAFDHACFYDWLRQTPFPVYVSEIAMPDDFVCIAENTQVSKLSAHGTEGKRTEKIFLHERFARQHPAAQPDLFS